MPKPGRYIVTIDVDMNKGTAKVHHKGVTKEGAKKVLEATLEEWEKLE